MKFIKKKGFTVVELVVVIAVIGILAAVLIPTFTRLIRRSRVNTDTQLIRNLNTALESDKVEKEHKTMSSALAAANAFGYDVTKINASATNNEIVWDSENDVFCYINEGELEYLPDSVDTDKKLTATSYKLWKIYTAAPQDGENYSIYVAGQGAADYVNTHDVNVGVDCGNYVIDNISYKNESGKREIVLNTNSTASTITVNGYVDPSDNTKGDVVYHYGTAGELNIVKCATASYHENGKIAYAEISSGRMVLEATSDVERVHINKKNDNSFDVVVIADNGSENLPEKITRDQVNVLSDKELVVKVEMLATGEVENVYVYPYTDSQSTITGTTEKTDVQNPTVVTALGVLVLDNGDDAGEKAMSNNDKEEVKSEIIDQAQAEEIAKAVEDGANYVARIGAKGYETLAAAVSAAVDGDTIEMLQNDTLTATVIVSKQISIDLNGCTVGRSNIASAIGVNGGELIINDSVGYGKILGNGQAVYTNAVDDVLTVNGGTIQGSTYGLRLVKGNTVTINGGNIIGGSYAVFNVAAKKLNINGGTISGAYAINTKSANCEITINGGTFTGSSYGINNTATANITINGGTISATASNSYAIQNTAENTVITVSNGIISGGNRVINTNKASSTISINGGTFTGGTYGIVNSGSLTVVDGTISANNYYAISNSGTLIVNGGTINGGTHASYGRGIYSSNGTVTINGGTINMKVESASMQVAIDNRKTLIVNGGTVNSDVIGIYSAGDFTLTSGVVNGKTQAIQSFGTTQINGGEINSETGTGINVAGGNVTVSDGSINAGVYGIYGKSDTTIVITVENVNIDAVKCLYLNSATASCDISNGIFNGGSEVCYAQNGFFTISGGTFTGTGSTNVEDHIYRYTLNCLDASYSADPATAGFTVTGGSFYQFNPQNDLSEGENTCFTQEGYHSEYNEETGYYTVVAD